MAATVGSPSAAPTSSSLTLTARYVVKSRDGRRHRYQLQSHLPLREAGARERAIGDVLNVLVESELPIEGHPEPR
jgi:hypothetical protein